MTAQAATADAHGEILALRAELLSFAKRLAPDEPEAERLVQFVISRALEETTPCMILDDTRIWLFARLRGAFHSVERRRNLNRTQRIPDRPWNTAQAAVYAAAPRIPS